MTSEEIKEKISQAESLMMLLPVTDLCVYSKSGKWDPLANDLIWFSMEFDNYKHLHDVMKIFEGVNLNPHIVPDISEREGVFEETVYLRLSPVSSNYNVTDQVWPEYRYASA